MFRQRLSTLKGHTVVKKIIQKKNFFKILKWDKKESHKKAIIKKTISNVEEKSNKKVKKELLILWYE